MREYFTEAIVLHKEAIGELDSRVSLFTEMLGRVEAKIISARRITSKLSPHLEPLFYSQVRLIEKNSLQVADALRIGVLPNSILPALRLVQKMMPISEPDFELWELLKTGDAPLLNLLAFFGFDARHATCAICSMKPTHFYIPDSSYLCPRCLPRPMNAEECFAV